MNKEDKKVVLIFSRYILLLLIAFFALSFFYSIFLPLTIYPTSSLLKLVYNSQVQGNMLLLGKFKIELIKACIASSAYYLLLLLNFAVPMPLKKRVLSLAFSFSLFLAINILRIFAFSLLYINSFKYFNLFHLAFWYVVSGIIVFIVWFLTIKLFSVKEIPFYTDLKFIYSKINRKIR